MPAKTASSPMPAASAISAGMASRLALSTDTLADELPMWRLSTVFSAEMKALQKSELSRALQLLE